MKFISWNVNGVRACYKKGLGEFFKKEQPDHLCLQETKAQREQCKEMWGEAYGYKDSWNSAERPGYSGVANFYKSEPKDVTHGMKDRASDAEGRVILSDLGEFYLINSYFPNGAASEERHFFKMAYLDKYLDFVQKLDKEKPVILCGDVNIAHKEVDIHDPVRLDGTSGFKPEERAWMDDYLAAGFVDAFRVLHPEAVEKYSWWSYRSGARPRNKGWRIDYFIVSERLAERITRLEMLHDVMGSDHCPVVMELS